MVPMTAPRPDPARFTDLEMGAWAGFLHTHAVITRALSDALEREHGLTINEFEVLLCLSLNERLKLSDLAARVNLTPSGMTGMVARLSRRGLVARCTCTNDARTSYLELTTAGTVLFAAAADAHAGRVRAWFLSRVTDTEQHTLAEIWARFQDTPAPAGHPLPGSDTE